MGFIHSRDMCKKEIDSLLGDYENNTNKKKVKKMGENEDQDLIDPTIKNYNKKENHHHNKKKDTKQNKFRKYPSNI